MTLRRVAVAALASALCATGAAEAKAPKAKARKPAPAVRDPHVLVYSGTAGFRHQSIPIGTAVLERLGRETGSFTTELIDQPSQLTTERLGRSDVVLWLSTTGAEAPFTADQRRRYEQWVSCGGGHVGVHASTDSYRDWPVWAELTGAFFKSHPVTPTSAADDRVAEEEGWGEPEATILVQDDTSGITTPWRGQRSFLLRDEFYALDGDPARVIADFRPLLAFGGFSDPLVSLLFGSAYAPQQPLAWTGSFRGRNRLAYTNLGHSGATWRRDDFRRSLVEMVSWVAGRRPAAGCLRAEGLLPPEPKAKKKSKKKTKKKAARKKAAKKPRAKAKAEKRRRPAPRG